MKTVLHKRLLFVTLASSVAAWNLAGCGGGAGSGGSSPSTFAPLSSASFEAEPSGGNWKPIVLSSADNVASLDSGAASQTGSQTRGASKAPAVTEQERAELRTLQARRTSGATEVARFWNVGASVRWNEIARSLVMKYKTSPPVASRQYAALSVAQYDAMVAAFKIKYKANRPSPSTQDSSLKPLFPNESDPVYPSSHATVSGASARVLAKFYPAESQFLADKAREAEESRLYAGLNYRSDIVAGGALGRDVADKVLAHVAKDGADAQLGNSRRSQTEWWSFKTNAEGNGNGARKAPSSGTDPSRWTGVNPLLPRWGEVKTWVVPSVVALRPAAPPKMDSAQFKADLAEVRRISDNRTAEQLRIAQFWADGAGTATPPGHWNQIAADLLVEKRTSELRSARAFALLNMALMDAGICCWDAKYKYYLLRPWMADPKITTPVGQPNFPTYTSGHSTFSGAAAEVLGSIFPDKKSRLDAMATEASMSRIYGGIHFRFDCEPAVEGGRKIGQLVIKRGERDGSK
ncbi:MAG TPA: phosphatase PAP2 family protein [Abditibacteriaceae bacterium]|jgi:hypothetical protein